MATKEKNETSKMMQHYRSTKAQYNDCVIFYRLGDFYELFDNDAIEMSKVLDLTLTSKSCGEENRAPMCGIPYHAADNYINKLVNLGYKVAICEQVSTPVKGKQVDREVVRVITPGTIIDSEIVDNNNSNYLACIYELNDEIALCYVEISTGEFVASEFSGEKAYESLNDLLIRIRPSETIYNCQHNLIDYLQIAKLGGLPNLTEYDSDNFDRKYNESNIIYQFGEDYLSKFKINKNSLMINAIGAMLIYLQETQKRTMRHINTIKIDNNKNYMLIDINSRKNLEILETMRDKRKKGALISVLDKTCTNMGKRLIRKWIEMPLCNLREINCRLDAVEEMTNNLIKKDNLKQLLKNLNDIERISGRIAYGNFSPKDAKGLKESLMLIPQIVNTLSSFKNVKFTSLHKYSNVFEPIVDLLEKAIAKDPPTMLSVPGYIKEGFSEELEKYRTAKETAAQIKSDIELKEQESTGIKNLRIQYNKVQGYFIEVNKQYTHLVPLRYVRKQTIANNERYTIPELQDLEDKVLNANDNAIKLEQKIFAGIRETLVGFIPKMQEVSSAIAEIDCILSFAEVATKNNYVKPKVTDKNNVIKIVEGRHPVVEDLLKNSTFIPNDTYLDDKENQVMIITGPNMAGKSTYMRQVAIITLMAHLGSFVPAKSAEISLTDKIFTRVGASDDLTIGQSTFMVEMMEVANILNNATDRSLVVLDEIGRGTSTYDGLSIAWAVVEHIAKDMNCKTLFATHYHELTELEGLIEGIKNYKISVKEYNDNLVFLRKIVRGGANRSFGIEVAKLAGVNENVIKRAKQISNTLENNNINRELVLESSDNSSEIFEKDTNYKEIVGILKDIDINKVTPLGAFDVLCDLIKKAGG